MKQMQVYIFILGTIVLSGCSIKEINPMPNSANADSYVKESEFRKGYQSAIEKERFKWEQRGYDRALRIVTKYSEEIRAYEAGKYAIESKFVTYPKLIALSKDGSIKLKSLGCDIRRDMTVDDIFHYYSKNKDTIPHNTTSFNPERKSSFNAHRPFASSAPMKIRREMSLPNEHKINRNRIVSNDSAKRSVDLELQKSYTNKALIDNFSLNCKENSTSYACSFPSREEKSLFCSRTKACSQ
jgi:hypothetical protein